MESFLKCVFVKNIAQRKTEKKQLKKIKVPTMMTKKEKKSQKRRKSGVDNYENKLILVSAKQITTLFRFSEFDNNKWEKWDTPIFDTSVFLLRLVAIFNMAQVRWNVKNNRIKEYMLRLHQIISFSKRILGRKGCLA